MTNISEIQVTKTIVNEFLDDFIQNILDTDVVVVGSGPCGVAAAKDSAEKGLKTKGWKGPKIEILERKPEDPIG